MCRAWIHGSGRIHLRSLDSGVDVARIFRCPRSNLGYCLLPDPCGLCSHAVFRWKEIGTDRAGRSSSEALILCVCLWRRTECVTKRLREMVTPTGLPRAAEYTLGVTACTPSNRGEATRPWPIADGERRDFSRCDHALGRDRKSFPSVGGTDPNQFQSSAHLVSVFQSAGQSTERLRV